MRTPSCVCILLLAGCSSLPSSPPAGGSISGQIAYPSESTPDMRICAIAQEATAHACTQAEAGAGSYRIANLPAGNYVIVAQLHEGDMRVGGHTHQVQCIRAPCPAQLQAVSVAPGAAVTGVDINEFYAARDDFPSMPVDGD